MNWEKRSKVTPSKNKFIKITSTVIVTALLSAGVVLGTNYLQKESVGIKAVELMYDFKDPYELDDNMGKLEDIMTKEVFEEVTIDNEERALNTYLKFKKNPVEVEIIKSTSSYVLYRLHTESITGNRKFMMTFDTDLLGNINYIREMEVIDFYPNLD